MLKLLTCERAFAICDYDRWYEFWPLRILNAARIMRACGVSWRHVGAVLQAAMRRDLL